MYQQILDLLPDSVLLLERKVGRWPLPKILHANRRFLSLVRLKADEVTGRTLGCLRGTALDRAAFRELADLVTSGQSQSTRLVMRDGRKLPRNVQVSSFLGDDVLLLILSERSEESRQASPVAPSTTLLSGLTGHVFYIQALGVGGGFRLSDIEPGFLHYMLGPKGVSEPPDQWQHLVIEEDWPILLQRHRLLAAGEPSDSVLRMRRHNGDIVTFRDRVRPLPSPSGGAQERFVGALEQQSTENDDQATIDTGVNLAATVSQSLHRMVVMLNAQGRLIWVAPEPAMPFADRLRSAAGVQLAALLPESEADIWLDALDHALETNARLSFVSPWSMTEDVTRLAVSLVPMGTSMALAIIGSTAPAGRTSPHGHDRKWPAVDLDALSRIAGFGYVLADQDGRISTANTLALSRLGGGGGEEAPLWLPEPFLALTGQEPRDTAAGQPALAIVAPAAGDGEQPAGLQESGPALFDRDRPILVDDVAWHRLHVQSGLDAQSVLLVSREAATDGGRPMFPSSWHEDALQSVDDGILAVDASGVVHWVNAAVSTITGIPRGGIVGRGITAVLRTGEAEADIKALRHAVRDRSGEETELTARRADGGIVPIAVEVRPVNSDDGYGEIWLVRDKTAAHQTEETFRSLAYHDPITGLPNRLMFYDRLASELDRVDNEGGMAAVLLVDLDRFKVINDSLGLERGDQLLKTAADRLQREMSERDMLARLGGDEFMVLLCGIAGTEEIDCRASRLIECLTPAIAIAGHEFTVTASIGIAVSPHDGKDVETLLKNADTALSRTKESGRGHCQFYTNDMNAAAFERLMLESRLRKAVDQNELVVYYQPQVSLITGQVTGVEALVRWFHPELGMVSPGEFIPVAEETGLIVSIGNWVLEQALDDLRLWQAEGFGHLRVAVNISARQFGQENLIDNVSALLAKTGIEPERLTLELTESVIMRDAEETIVRLQQLRALGVGLSVDDFGTGYSSLGYLRRFPIATLKIDRSFTRDIDGVENGDAIPRAIVAMSASLGLRVIAEGVETERQLEALCDYGCDEMQGFLFSRPIPSDQLLELLREGKSVDIPGT